MSKRQPSRRRVSPKALFTVLFCVGMFAGLGTRLFGLHPVAVGLIGPAVGLGILWLLSEKA